MPRKPREIVEGGVYHIVLKSINGQKVFFDDDDRRFFLDVLKKSCIQYDVELLAYCLMSNHVHLMLKFNEKNASNLFQSFGASFVLRYNLKNNRNGAIFNGRYYSKNIDDDAYLTAVLRYIHLNPVKAEICNDCIDYKWSSYSEYVLKAYKYVNSDFVSRMFSENQFYEIHIKNDQINDFIVANLLGETTEKEVNQFVHDLFENNEVDDVFGILKKAKISNVMVSKALNCNYSTIRRMK